MCIRDSITNLPTPLALNRSAGRKLPFLCAGSLDTILLFENSGPAETNGHSRLSTEICQQKSVNRHPAFHLSACLGVRTRSRLHEDFASATITLRLRVATLYDGRPIKALGSTETDEGTRRRNPTR